MITVRSKRLFISVVIVSPFSCLNRFSSHELSFAVRGSHDRRMKRVRIVLLEFTRKEITITIT